VSAAAVLVRAPKPFFGAIFDDGAAEEDGDNVVDDVDADAQEVVLDDEGITSVLK
jgi:hypothetical protein